MWGSVMSLYQNKYRIESARLQSWDYSSPGYYFVTICAHDRRCLFGAINGCAKMILNNNGVIVSDCIGQIPDRFPNAINDTWVVMPNHVHGIIQLIDGLNCHIDRRPYERRDVACNVSTGNVSTGNVSTGNVSTAIRKKMSAISPKRNSLSVILRSFKSGISNRLHAQGFVGDVWQPRFHDHIIRNDRELFAIRKYIQNNPANWHNDRNVIETLEPEKCRTPWSEFMG